MSKRLINLVILRHGEAGAAQVDRDRSLTDYGKQQICSQYEWLCEQKFQPELILHSPYKRTVQSASLSEDYFPESKLQVESMITPDGDPAMVASMLRSTAVNSILIVSHMPMVSYLTIQLKPEIELFGFPVAGLCWLEISQDDLSANLIHKHWPDLTV